MRWNARRSASSSPARSAGKKLALGVDLAAAAHFVTFSVGTDLLEQLSTALLRTVADPIPRLLSSSNKA